VPVLVVKAQGESAAQAGSTPKAAGLHVLAAYDPADSAAPIADALKQFAWPPDARCCVMTVVRPMFLADLPDWVQNQPRDPDIAAMADEWKKEHEQNLASARSDLDRFRKSLPACFRSADVIVAEGRPAELIVAKAQELGIDLVVLGSPHGGRLERLFIGSTTESVLASAGCSVLVTQ
jgi:nucleotide-binding universal stress UspA family protein